MNQEPNMNEPTEIEKITEAEEMAKAPKKGNGIASSLFDILEMFAWSVFAVMILFSFTVRLCRVEGGSMENTLYNGENLLLYSLAYTPQQDDIIVFHLTKEETNPPMVKTMVKRVIATEGQQVEINFNTGVILVDGMEYADSHAVLKDRYSDKITEKYSLFADHHFNAETRIFSATVPEGQIFVMGDNRNNSKDSRDADVGFVDARCVLGKVIVRIAPFSVFS